MSHKKCVCVLTAMRKRINIHPNALPIHRELRRCLNNPANTTARTRCESRRTPRDRDTRQSRYRQARTCTDRLDSQRTERIIGRTEGPLPKRQTVTFRHTLAPSQEGAQERGRPVKKAEQGTQAIRTGGRSVPPLSGPLFLVDVDGLGNMPSSQRLVGEQSLGRAERRCPTACCAP